MSGGVWFAPKIWGGEARERDYRGFLILLESNILFVYNMGELIRFLRLSENYVIIGGPMWPGGIDTLFMPYGRRGEKMTRMVSGRLLTS